MDLSKNQGFIWLDGRMVDWREANVHVLTHTLHYGVGVFEGVRAYNTPKGPSIFRLQDHTDRLFKSAGIVNMEIPYAKETINNAHIDVVNLNNIGETTGSGSINVFRITAYGVGGSANARVFLQTTYGKKI